MPYRTGGTPLLIRDDLRGKAGVGGGGSGPFPEEVTSLLGIGGVGLDGVVSDSLWVSVSESEWSFVDHCFH